MSTTAKELATDAIDGRGWFRPRLRGGFRTFRWVFIAAGTAFLTHGLWLALDSHGRLLPESGSMAVAFAASVVWLTCAAKSWTVLFERSTPEWPLARAYFASLLGRYIPGGVWQAAGQVSFSYELGVPGRWVASLVVVQGIIHAAAGGVMGATLAISGSALPVWTRAVALVGALSFLLLRRRWISSVAAHLGRLLPGMGEVTNLIPSQGALVRSFVWAMGSVGAAGAAFAALAESVVPGTPPLVAVSAFCFAWTVGFLCLPVPAGAGIREAVLLLAIPAAGPQIILVSVLHRAISMAAELVVLVFVVSSGKGRRMTTHLARHAFRGSATGSAMKGTQHRGVLVDASRSPANLPSGREHAREHVSSLEFVLMSMAAPPLSFNAWLRFDVIRRLLRRLDGESFLEIGCGEGALGYWLADRFDYVAYEPDRDSAVTARQRIGGRGRVENSHLPENPPRRFDLIGAFEVLEHIEDDSAALRSWCDWMVPGGFMLLSVPAGPERFAAADRRVGHHRRYSRAALAGLMEEAGLEQPEVLTYGFPIGYVLESARNWLAAREENGGATAEDRTAESGRWRQPTNSWLPRVATYPFRWTQRPFLKSSLGTGLIGIAQKPE